MKLSDQYDSALLRNGHGGLLRLTCTECPAAWDLYLSRAEFSDYYQRTRTIDQWTAVVTAGHDRERHPGEAAAA